MRQKCGHEVIYQPPCCSHSVTEYWTRAALSWSTKRTTASPYYNTINIKRNTFLQNFRKSILPSVKHGGGSVRVQGCLGTWMTGCNWWDVEFCSVAANPPGECLTISLWRLSHRDDMTRLRYCNKLLNRPVSYIRYLLNNSYYSKKDGVHLGSAGRKACTWKTSKSAASVFSLKHYSTASFPYNKTMK